MEKDDLDERILDLWLRLSTTVNNERVVQSMPYNEALICNILDKAAEGEKFTATDLCEKTKMLKSQMNRTLNSMENKGLIVRERSDTDKRKFYIKLSPEHISEFEDEHQKNLSLVRILLDRFGRERGEALADELGAFVNIVEDVVNEKSDRGSGSRTVTDREG